MNSLKLVVLNNYLLNTVIVEIHSKVYVSDSLYLIRNGVVRNVNFGEWRVRALEGYMLHVNGDTCIDPSRINKFVVCECDIAMVLGVYHGCVTANIQASEGVVVPYLIISDESIFV